ncbi:MAG: hypothetical protein HY234_08460 [Acidobacteria bacterium]|nr:hypothetical protein [Acidobacteriota bacterium]MBI3663063.1 hypothetical protein [Acidobacteriota bacterium]
MADERNSEKAMAGMLKRKGVWPPAAARDACPDAATLAACFERALTAPEAARWESHFSSCLRCQEQLAVLVRSEPAAASRSLETATEKQPSFFRLWDWRWMAPAGAVAAALVFWVFYDTTLRVPSGSTESRELMVRREATNQPPATAGPERSADASPAKKDALTGAVPAEKPFPAPGQDEGRRTLDELQRKKSAPAAERASASQALKDKSVGPAEAVSGAVPSSAPAKPAAEQTRVAAANAPVAPAQPSASAVTATAQAETSKTQLKVAEADRAQAAPAENVATSNRPASGGGVQALPKQERGAVTEEKKERATQAQNEFRVEAQATASVQEGAAAKQAPADERHAVGVMSRSRAKSARLAGEFIVTTPNSKVLWRFGSSGLIERSRDAGKTWQRQTSPTQEPFLAGSAPSENVCWAGGSNGVLLRTIDGGENWERISSPTQGDIIAVRARDQFNVTVVAADGRAYETRNAGTLWRAP